MYRKFTPPFLSLLIVACAGLQQRTAEVRVPDKLKPQSSEWLAMIVRAKGVQVYECRAKRTKSVDMNGCLLLPKPISST